VSPALVATAVMILVWVVTLISVAPVMLWAERRIPAFMQDRRGPNRVGPIGLFQAIADAVKLIVKENLTPASVDRPLYLMAPVLALIPALTTYLVIPFGPEVEIGGHRTKLVVVDSDVGILLLLALASLGVYALVLAGYSSHNKYSLLGSIRASAQMISYELALTTAVVCALLPAGSLNLSAVVDYQRAGLWQAVTQPLGFLVFLVAMFAETNRLPFDLPEAESELVAGYLTEYGALRWAMFFMGEYMSMAALSALFATLYLGGWSLPFLDFSTYSGLTQAILGFTVLMSKVAVMMFVYVWVRWTFPRFRYDQLMRLGWKVLLPLAVLQLVITAAMTIGGVL
jgi:NADH-quinone oxidoreductase subunit H